MDRKVGRKRTTVAERLLQHHQQTHHHGEEGGTFHESGGQDHVGAEVVDGLRLTGHGLHSITTDAADANTSAKGGETSTEGGMNSANPLGSGRFSRTWEAMMPIICTIM